MALGFSFAPTTSNAQQTGTGGAPAFRAQEPLRTLHFELPRVDGAPAPGSISPLVGAGGTGSSIGQAVLQSVLKTVLGADAASALLSGSPAAAAAPRMGIPGAPTSAAPRVTGGGSGGATTMPQELPNLSGGAPNFGTLPKTPPPTFIPGGGDVPVDGRAPMAKLPDEMSAAPTAPDFGRGPDTFGGGMDNEARMNNRSPLYYQKY